MKNWINKLAYLYHSQDELSKAMIDCVVLVAVALVFALMFGGLMLLMSI